MENDKYNTRLFEKSSSDSGEDYKKKYEDLSKKTTKSNGELEGRLNGE